ncbi:PREDICTED: DNA repair protein complementing XP-C cells homolog [Trachymyrmex cornetzi]|uniref:DNA repair protein complementing XP-C cells like protein n=1 Tax=Trachymyrmex cornetzi TaxID=471704 RepID=A0A195EKT3_9HYME|nr:PREDICTED: DNA repair protein complementing XP-C cells homolog [Trachymyrmex cornetzi]XP_018374837.1 PREDICTED: DNA repair protein complementing XP-C cells homolog [Trachymyrmex cornetzi]KYN28880.1 DNA repair protein complementing XP-C cells like protein [Trachymyrmex cornetzi]
MKDSDDDSSDSSNDFAGITPKDELTASFFSVKSVTKPNLIDWKDNSEDESSDDENFASVPENNSIELFSEVVKNLEASQRASVNDEEPEQHFSKYDSTHVTKEIKIEKKKNISDEINAVLLQGESGTQAFREDDEDTNDDEKQEEDVKRPEDYTIPKEGVQITLPGTSMVFKKKTANKRESDLAALLRKKLKANQIIIEKAARLCWLAYGFHLNHQANEPEIMATAVSLVSTKSYPKDNFSLEYLEKFTKWFKNMFTIQSSHDQVIINKETLLKRIAEKKIYNYRELVILYVAILRGIGFHCRLVVSLNPPLVKASNELLPKTSTVKKDSQIKDETKAKKTSSKENKKNVNSKENKKNTNSKETKKNVDSKKDLKNSSIIQNNENARRNANEEAKKRAAEILRSKYSYSKKNKDKLNSNIVTQDDASTSKNIETASTSSRKVESGPSGPSPRRLRSSKHNVPSSSIKQNKIISEDNQPKTKNAKRQSRSNSSSSEKEEEESPSKAKRKCSDKNKTAIKSKRKNEKQDQASTDEEMDKLKKRQDIWAEIYVESKASWICVNVINGSVDCVAEIYKKASKPVLYVIAYNSERLVKDVTRRYCPQWLSVTRKQRIDEKWWIETLSYWQERETTISKQEDELLLQKELEQPLPKTVGECKGHPLYVLIRHLLKYEALYPSDCVPLGHLKTGEAIYSRYCVHTLCSRETWLKKARVVKPKQDPYKIVKALPKYDKLSGMRLKDSALELFGEWQTTDYVPPEAKDGIVPRNEYGNVDLFKKCMLPKGTVHIILPGLNRVARKLNIDCATAVVGFNFGCMGAVPAIEGYVVCAEYEDTLREAWEAEQIEAAKRAAEKAKKKVYANWRKLIRGLLIRERLQEKYNFREESKEQSNKRPKSQKDAVKKSKAQ